MRRFTWNLGLALILAGCSGEQVDPWADGLEWLGAATGVGGLGLAARAMRRMAGPSRSQGQTDRHETDLMALRERVARLEGMMEDHP